MVVKKFYLQIYRHPLSTAEEEIWVDTDSLGIHPDTAQLLADLGIVEYRLGRLPARQAERIQKILRLRKNLGVNLCGAAIILDLLDRIEGLQDELEKIKRR